MCPLILSNDEILQSYLHEKQEIAEASKEKVRWRHFSIFIEKTEKFLHNDDILTQNI